MTANIVLIGMPAVGKSTVGVLLAKRMGFDFLDTDILIQTREKATLPRIIQDRGLASFLRIEEKHLCDLAVEAHVIATGGSAVYKAAAMDHLSRNGILVYLSLGLPELKTRLSDLTGRGVAIAPGRSLEDLYRERTPLYEAAARVTVDCTGLRPDQVADAVVRNLPE